MRRKLTKTERQQVYDKCHGHCAYCGCVLDYKDMQVDHCTPVKNWPEELAEGRDVNDFENLLPACRSCNHYKATLDVEGYRKYLAGISQRLMRDSIPYQVAIRFGIVTHVRDDIIFYFEDLVR